MTLPKASKLPSGRWRTQLCVGRNDAGKRIFKSFTADTETESVWMAMEYQKEHKDDDVKTDPTIAQAFHLYIQARDNILSPSTIHGYEIISRTRLQHIMNIKCSEITVADIQIAINIDAKTLSQKSIKSAVGLLKSVLSLQDVSINWNKITLPQRKKQQEQLPSVDLILSSIVGTDIELPCLLAMWCSMRISEIRGLKFSDLSSDGTIITVQRAKMYINGKDVVRESTKTYESTRTIVLPEYIQELIKKSYHGYSDAFIVDLGYNAIYKKYARLMKQKGVITTFHKLRHCFATTLNDLGVPSNYIQKLGGWSTDVVMKNVYTHTTDSKEQEYGSAVDSYFMEKLRNIV